MSIHLKNLGSGLIKTNPKITNKFREERNHTMTEIIADFLDTLDTPALETLEQFEKMIEVTE